MIEKYHENIQTLLAPKLSESGFPSWYGLEKYSSIAISSLNEPSVNPFDFHPINTIGSCSIRTTVLPVGNNCLDDLSWYSQTDRRDIIINTNLDATHKSLFPDKSKFNRHIELNTFTSLKTEDETIVTLLDEADNNIDYWKSLEMDISNVDKVLEDLYDSEFYKELFTDSEIAISLPEFENGKENGLCKAELIGTVLSAIQSKLFKCHVFKRKLEKERLALGEKLRLHKQRAISAIKALLEITCKTANSLRVKSWPNPKGNNYPTPPLFRKEKEDCKLNQGISNGNQKNYFNFTKKWMVPTQYYIVW